MKHPDFLKAILFTEDFCEVGGSVLQSGCYTVLDYRYRCFRNRDELGNIYGAFRSGYLEFTIRADAERGAKRFYQRMAENENASFSFIFNATFSPTGRISGFEDATVTYGYVVDIVEFCQDADADHPEQLQLRIKVLLSNIFYVGQDSLHKLFINND